MATKTTAKQSPIDRTIANKEKLILKHRKEIESVRENAAREIKNIEFRISLAQTLVDALKKGK